MRARPGPEGNAKDVVEAGANTRLGHGAEPASPLARLTLPAEAPSSCECPWHLALAVVWRSPSDARSHAVRIGNGLHLAQPGDQRLQGIDVSDVDDEAVVHHLIDRLAVR